MHIQLCFPSPSTKADFIILTHSMSTHHFIQLECFICSLTITYICILWTSPNYGSHHGFFDVGIKVLSYIYHLYFRYFQEAFYWFLEKKKPIFLFIFQNFEVKINSNVVKYNSQAWTWQMTMNKQTMVQLVSSNKLKFVILLFLYYL